MSEDSLLGEAEGAAAPEPTQAEPAEAPKWFYADDVPGNGDKPEYFKDSKYKSLAEQAKAYTELEKKFGSFTGAPEEYELALSEEIREKGFDISPDDPLYQSALEFAKNSNMSQEGFNGMVELYAMTELAKAEALQSSKEDEIKALGQNAQSRLSGIDSWAKANLPEDLYGSFAGLVTTADSVKVIEALISKTRAGAMNPDSVSANTGATEEEVRRMQFEKDEYGNRRIQTDPDFKKRYQQLRDQVWGSEEHRITVG